MKTIGKLLENYSKTKRKLFENYSKSIRKLFKNHSKTIQKLFQQKIERKKRNRKKLNFIVTIQIRKLRKLKISKKANMRKKQKRDQKRFQEATLLRQAEGELKNNIIIFDTPLPIFDHIP